MKMRALSLSVLLLLGLIGAAAAQVVPGEPAGRWNLNRSVAEEVQRRLNDAGTQVREGGVTLAGGASHPGDLAVLDGDLVLGGRVEGNVLVVNGDVRLLSGASVNGDLRVVGGRIAGLEGAAVRGEIVTHPERFAYERVNGRVRIAAAAPSRGGASGVAGTSDFLITTGRSYNRVEGLPIAFGPRLATEGPHPLRLEALAIYRSESGFAFNPELMGYFVRAHQYAGGGNPYHFGGTLYSLVEPIEDWQMSDLESGLATFFFHRDYRDHYHRQGGSVFASWEPPASPILVHLEGRLEKHGSRVAGSPWSLFRNAEEWRPQPVAAEGSVGSLLLRGEYDTRSSTWNPASGWLARAQVEQALRVDLNHPVMAGQDADPAALLDLPHAYGRFLAGLLDLRRYNRVDAGSRLNFRLVAGGSLMGDPLPPQRQHALGGEGSLPGYALFSSDCGARAERVILPAHPTRDGATFFPHYGCDVFTLFQAEYRGRLAFRFRWNGGPWGDERDQRDGLLLDLDMSPDWSIFVDAGQGWTFHDRPDEPLHVNVGAGILLDRIGLYLAVPIEGGSGPNLFLRLGPRF
jgi:hypothetical protein